MNIFLSIDNSYDTSEMACFQAERGQGAISGSSADPRHARRTGLGTLDWR